MTDKEAEIGAAEVAGDEKEESEGGSCGYSLSSLSTATPIGAAVKSLHPPICVPLEFQKEAVDHLLDHDCLIVLGRGLGVHSVIIQFVRNYILHTHATQTPPVQPECGASVVAPHNSTASTTRGSAITSHPKLESNLKSEKIDGGRVLNCAGLSGKCCSSECEICRLSCHFLPLTVRQPSPLAAAGKVVLLLNCTPEEVSILKRRLNSLDESLFGFINSSGGSVVACRKIDAEVNSCGDGQLGSLRGEQNSLNQGESTPPEEISDGYITSRGSGDHTSDYFKDYKPYYIGLPFHVVPPETSQAERTPLYCRGGLLAISTRILVTDLLTGRLPTSIIDGIIVNNAHR